MSLTGILLDVSASTRENVGSGTDEKGGPWVQSIFSVIDDLIENDVTSEDRVFAIGVGANRDKHIFDVIGTVQEIENENRPAATHQQINQIFDILETNGASNVRKWADNITLIQEHLSHYLAALVLRELVSDKHFLTKFVDEILPPACRDKIASSDEREKVLAGLGAAIGAGLVLSGVGILPGLAVFSMSGAKLLGNVRENVATSAVSSFKTATSKEIKEVIEKTKSSLSSKIAKCKFLKDVATDSDDSIFSVQDAFSIIRGCVDEKELSKERQEELLKNAEPFIYGETPLFESLKKATELFERVKKSASGSKNEENREQKTGIENRKNQLATRQHITQIFDILEINGVSNIRKWANDVVLIQEELSDYLAELILRELKYDKLFFKKFVYEILPPACRNTVAPYNLRERDETEDVTVFPPNSFKPATRKEIKEIVKKTERCLSSKRVVNSEIDVATHSDDSKNVHGKTKVKKDASVNKKKENDTFENKLLFVLSHGRPTDGNFEDKVKVDQATYMLKKAGVKIVSCFITRSENIDSKRLYDEIPDDWEPEARFLFWLSSEVAIEYLPVQKRSILRKRGWKIDIANNETRLFVQVNHPDHLREAGKMAREIVCCHDTLSDYLLSIDLDIYINRIKVGLKARDQKNEKTCYAYASATVLDLAIKRIFRPDKCPNFEELLKEMIEISGKNGAKTKNVLQEMCSKYRLHSEKVSTREAKEAIVDKRPVVATFRLTEIEWKCFNDFYYSENTQSKILTQKELNISKRPKSSLTFGHAVVLTSFNSKCLTFMNSMGDEFGDKGFFRVQNADVLGMDFFDVYCNLDELTDEEKEYYKQHKTKVAEKQMKSSKDLQNAEYTWPECHQSLPVNEFTGTLSKVPCPKRKDDVKERENNSKDKNTFLKDIFLDTHYNIKEDVHEKFKRFSWLNGAYGLKGPNDKIPHPHLYITVKKGTKKTEVVQKIKEVFGCQAEEYFELFCEPERKPTFKYKSKPTSGGGIVAFSKNNNPLSALSDQSQGNNPGGLCSSGTITMFCSEEDNHYALTCFHVGCGTDEHRSNKTFNNQQQIDIQESLDTYKLYAEENQEYYYRDQDNESTEQNCNSATPVNYIPLGEFSRCCFYEESDIMSIKVREDVKIHCRVDMDFPDWDSIWEELWDRVVCEKDTVTVQKHGYPIHSEHTGHIVQYGYSYKYGDRILFKNAIVVKGLSDTFLRDGDSGALMCFHSKSGEKQAFAYGVCEIDEKDDDGATGSVRENQDDDDFIEFSQDSTRTCFIVLKLDTALENLGLLNRGCFKKCSGRKSVFSCRCSII